MRRRAGLGAIAAVASLLLVIACAPVDAQAQAPPLKAGTVEVKRAVGTVEVQRQGQSAWTRIAAGGKLSERDHIRALAGGSADLQYPDGSSVLLAENSRLIMTALGYDAATQRRDIASHLAVGKIKAEVKLAAVQLIRTRQSNFNISTPVGVAAVRGTVVFIAFNPATGQIFVAATPSLGQPPISAQVSFVTTGPAGVPVTVTISGGQFTTKVGDAAPSTPQPLSTMPPAAVQALGTPANPQTTGDPNLTAVVREVTKAEMDQIIASAPPPVTPPPTVTGPPPPPPSEEKPKTPPAPSGRDVSPTG